MSQMFDGFEPPTGETMSVANYIKGALSMVKDEGTAIDAGGGMGQRDMWVKIDGKEFLVTVKECE
jgi:hypothetical protein